MKTKRMKTVMAWAHVTPTNCIVNFFAVNVFRTRSEARLKLGGMAKYGMRIARVEIREVTR